MILNRSKNTTTKFKKIHIKQIFAELILNTPIVIMIIYRKTNKNKLILKTLVDRQPQYL